MSFLTGLTKRATPYFKNFVSNITTSSSGTKPIINLGKLSASDQDKKIAIQQLEQRQKELEDELIKVTQERRKLESQGVKADNSATSSAPHYYN